MGFYRTTKGVSSTRPASSNTALLSISLCVAALSAARALSDDTAHASARRVQRSSKFTKRSMPNDAKSMTAAIAVAPA